MNEPYENEEIYWLMIKWTSNNLLFPLIDKWADSVLFTFKNRKKRVTLEYFGEGNWKVGTYVGCKPIKADEVTGYLDKIL